MAKIDRQTKAEVAQLLRQLSVAKTVKESQQIVEQIEKKVTEATTKT
jgi:hypothetical protein